MKVRSIGVLSLLCLVIVAFIPATASAKFSTVPVSYKATLVPVAMYGAHGSAMIQLHPRLTRLNVTVVIKGLTPREPFSVAIVGFADGSKSRFPTPAADTNHDGLISYSESTAFTGTPLLGLSTGHFAKRHGATVVKGTFTGSALTALNPYGGLLTKRAVVVYGVTQWPSYAAPFFDPTAPSAFGAITSNAF